MKTFVLVAALFASSIALAADSKTVHKFGRNGDVSAAAPEDVWSAGGVYVWPAAAMALEVLSSNAADNADGAGARTVAVEGLDGNFAEISETVTLAGTKPVATTKTFRRVNRMFVTSGGTYDSSTAASSAGVITARIAGGGAVQATLDRVDGMSMNQTQVARYTVPAGYTASLARMECIADAAKPMRVYLWQRQDADKTTAPVTPKRLVRALDGVSGHVNVELDAQVSFPAKTDLWMTAAARADKSAIDCTFDLRLTAQ